MGLFDSVRGALGGDETDAEPELTDDVPRPANHGEPTPTDFRNKAVDAVQDWGVDDLDFTVDSLPRLDTFADKQGARLDVMAADGDDDEAVARMHTAYTIRAGSYFGEVLVREAGGQWTRDGAVWAVQLPTGDDSTLVDAFEVAAHSFAETPAFAETARQLGVDVDDGDDEDDEPEPVDVRPEMREVAESVGDTWDAYALDFSPASVVRLDALVETEFDPREFDGVDVGGDGMEAKMYRERLKQFGSYFGEVIVRHLDGEWNRRAGEVVVDVSAGSDGWVTVPVFDVAGEGLRGAPRFVLEYNRCIEDAGLDVNAVDPSEPSTDADHDATLDAAPPETAPTDEPPTSPAEPADDPVEPAPAEPTAATDGPAEPARNEPATADDGSTTPSSEDPPAGATASGPEDAVGGDHPAAPDQAADGTARADADRRGVERRDDERPEDERTGPGTTDESAAVDDAEASDPAPAEGADDDVVAAAADALADDEGAVESADDAGGGDSGIEDGETLDLGDGGGGAEPVTAAAVTEDAKGFAATWPGYDLDFTPKSLERLDRLVSEEYATDDVPEVVLDGSGVDDSYLTARIVETGGYFAAVLRRSVGGEWREGESLTFVIEGRRGETRLDPVAIAADCFRGEESFAAAYADVRNSVGASGTGDGR